MTDQSSQTFSLSPPAEFEKWREKQTYEYEFKKCFALNVPPDWVDAGLYHDITRLKMNDILNFNSGWLVDGEDGKIRFQRNLTFYPPSDIKRWKIVLRICEWVSSGDTTSNVTFEAVISEEKNWFIFKHCMVANDLESLQNLVAHTQITVLANERLEFLIGKSVDFTENFDEANLILDMAGTKFYYLFELLAVQSQFFYSEWLQLKGKEGDIPTIILEELNPSDVLLVLKMLYYKKTFVSRENVQKILYIAHRLKLERILKHCEHFLISQSEDSIDRGLKLHLAHRYGLNGQLQSIASSASSNFPAKPTPLHAISAKKFELPEMMTKFVYDGVVTMRPTPNFAVETKINAVINWAIGFHNHSGSGGFWFSARPSFNEATRTNPLRFANWMIVVDFKLQIQGQNDLMLRATFTTGTFSINKMISRNLVFPNGEPVLVPYKLEIDVKCVKGLRYYVKSYFHDFTVKQPSHDIILVAEGKMLFANLNILAHNSLYFAGMKRQLDTVPVDEVHGIPKVEYEDMSMADIMVFLVCVYSWNFEALAEERIEQILRIVNRFLCTGLKRAIESFLGNNKNFPMGLKTLQIALDYDLPYVKDEYLKNLQSPTEIHALSADPEYKNLSNEAKIALFDRLGEIPLNDSFQEE